MDRFKKLLHPQTLFTAMGALIGYLQTLFIGCQGGCPLNSNPILSMLYMGTVGWLLSSAFKKS